MTWEQTLHAARTGQIHALLDNGDCERCPVCGGVSAYAWELCDEETGKENGIAHIPTAGSWEWECGHCRAHLVERDSPLNHPCYTHEEGGEEEE